MNISENLILIDGRDRTKSIKSCHYVAQGKYRIEFKDGNIRYFPPERIIHLTSPVVCNPEDFVLFRKGYDKPYNNISGLRRFDLPDGSGCWWSIAFNKGEPFSIDGNSIRVDPVGQPIFKYFSEVAKINSLRTNDEGEESLLYKMYMKVESIPEESVADIYLTPGKESRKREPDSPLVFPFGCNASQKKAVTTAFTNQVSIIQGPPGTGKTQTILNILANILTRGESAIIVSNNNDAVINVKDKLTSRGMDFLVANLGNKENKELFIKEHQSETYPPCLKDWDIKEPDSATDVSRRFQEAGKELDGLFELRENLAKAKTELQAVKLEQLHHESLPHPTRKLREDISSDDILSCWKYLNRYSTLGNGWFASIRRWLFRLRLGRLTGRMFVDSTGKPVFPDDLHSFQTMIETLKSSYYKVRIRELEQFIITTEQELLDRDESGYMKSLTDNSMTFLKYTLFRKYGRDRKRTVFTSPEQIRERPKEFIDEYPIVLSTTFSSFNNFGSAHTFDYVIMDESSQVPPCTGLLALACAKRAVIVGDTRQLGCVITSDEYEKIKGLNELSGVPDAYDCSRMNFLDSVSAVIKDAAHTLLREHYRCHPRIINFCNRKFYNGQLIVMTEDNDEQDVLHAVRTVPGNHERNNTNRREVDETVRIIRKSVETGMTQDSIGVISPFNNHNDTLKGELKNHGWNDIDIGTIHKFQGREKNAIIINTVKNEMNEFVDDAHMVNVAVSRAKDKLILVTNGNDTKDGNYHDLLGYIEYNDCTVEEGKVHSIFDYLYKQYDRQRINYLDGKTRISEYDSENIAYSLILKILKSYDRYIHLDVLFEYPLRTLLPDMERLDEEQRRYANNPWTHADFLIYNTVDKQPVLVIEVDGFSFHSESETQTGRDRKKDLILQTYGIPCLRLSTTGSEEERQITQSLDAALRNKRFQ